MLIGVATLYALNRTNGTLVSSGQKREYLLYVPKGYDRTRPAPLVISMHGVAGWPAQQRNTSRWNRLADEQGFLVVYPSGSDVPRMWHVESGAALEKDVRFISDLIDTLETAPTTSTRRGSMRTGSPNGGGMAFVLSCRLSDRIARSSGNGGGCADASVELVHGHLGRCR